MTTLVAHLLVAGAVLVDPWLSCVLYQRMRRQIATGVPDARVRLYRQIVIAQVVSIGLIMFCWRSGQIPAASLGLAAPRSWLWSMATIVAIFGTLAWSSLRLRPRAEAIREKTKDGIGALLPESHRERSWWGVVSVGAGISEELMCRGFLLYYLSVYLPQTNMLERVVLTSLVFGLAHIYQGWKHAVAAGVLGLLFAGFYLMTGSLLLPMVIHAALDSRVLLMFPPEPAPMLALEGHA
jgi:membrane protease YdiL (CAAX protease family)